MRGEDDGCFDAALSETSAAKQAGILDPSIQA